MTLDNCAVNSNTHRLESAADSKGLVLPCVATRRHCCILLVDGWTQELDDTAAFRNAPSKWGDDLEFPLPFGRALTAAEEYVHGLDESTGASLKFTVLNPKGRVWLMVAGGGASVIYAGEGPSPGQCRGGQQHACCAWLWDRLWLSRCCCCIPQ